CDELVALGERLREGSEAPFARALSALGRHAAGAPEAKAALDEALEALRAVDAKQRLAFVLTQAAGVELERGDASAALALAAEAATVAEALGRQSDIARAHAAALRSAVAAGARDAAELHRRALESLKPDQPSSQARSEMAAALVEAARRPSGRRRDGTG